MSGRALGISVLDGIRGGELLVNVDRPLLTYDFTYSMSDTRSGLVLATGKVTAIDGPHAAEAIAKELVQEMQKARAGQEAQANQQEAISAGSDERQANSL